LLNNSPKNETTEQVDEPNPRNKPLIWWLGYIVIAILAFIYVYGFIKDLVGSKIVTFIIFFGWLYLMDFIWSLVLGYSPRKK